MKQAEKFRRAKSEWVSKFIPAPPGAWLCGKLRPVRFRRRAWVFQTNGTGPLSAVGAAFGRPQAFPVRGRCRAKRGG